MMGCHSPDVITSLKWVVVLLKALDNSKIGLFFSTKYGIFIL